MNDPLLPYLLDILSDPASKRLIFAGGFGILLKREHIAASRIRTVIPAVPPARSTQDLDFFLYLDLFIRQEGARQIREMLERLAYVERLPRWQFKKALGDQFLNQEFRVDLLARLPNESERKQVKVKSPRVGSGSPVHGWGTPEAFAVEDQPVQLRVHGVRSDGRSVEVGVQVPHPYAWINMKVQAAYDWLLRERGELEPKADSDKHAFDVYTLVAMLTEDELAQASALHKKYAANPLAQSIKRRAGELYGDAHAPGSTEATRQNRNPIDYATFWEAIQEVLGI